MGPMGFEPFYKVGPIKSKISIVLEYFYFIF